MKQSVIATILACLLMGAAGGYGIGYAMYEPKIRNYEIQTSNLMSEVSELSQTISSQETQILTLESEKSRLQSDVTSYKEQVNTLESDVASYKGQVNTLEAEKFRLLADVAIYKGQVNTVKSEMSGLQNRLNKILSIKVLQYYEWAYKWKTWQWDLQIPLSIYVEYLERPRPVLGASYVDMAKDPKDDAYIDQLVQQINSAATKEGFTEIEKVNFVIAFIQSLPYTVDIETTPYDEYPRYPVETLFDRGGDCEDTSILVAALLDRMGYDVALLLLENAKHMAVGVSIPSIYGSSYKYDGKKYFYLETTGEGYQIGQIPPSITDTSSLIYPLRS